MKSNKTVILLSAIVIILSVLAFKPNPEKKVYDYLTIHSFNNDLDQVYISIGGKEFKNLHLNNQSTGAWDFNPLLKLINSYESEGWELQNFNALKSADMFIMMRREK